MSSLSNIPFDAKEFSGQRVLITGRTKGTGKAIAERFRQGGATVIVTARTVPEEKTDSHFIQADVSTPEGTMKVITRFWSAFNASTSLSITWRDHLHRAAVLTVTDEIWQQNFNENLGNNILDTPALSC